MPLALSFFCLSSTVCWFVGWPVDLNRQLNLPCFARLELVHQHTWHGVLCCAVPCSAPLLSPCCKQVQAQFYESRWGCTASKSP